MSYMKYRVLLFSAAGLIATAVQAQKTKPKTSKPAAKPVVQAPVTAGNPWVFTYGTDTVYKNEFERLLTKNRNPKETPTEENVREYLELYQNFKMKVREAKLMQLDTFTSFKTELAGYRKQLANPYLTDKKVTDGLIKEAYEHMQTEVKASHILVTCSENAKPADTLAAYNKILALRNRIVKGEAFDSVAAKESQDPSAVSNYGNLGWFSAFDMIYDFEKMAYTTPKGQLSMPFRTRFGYHIIKVADKRAARGEVKVQHLMRTTGENATAETRSQQKQLTDSIWNMIKNGSQSFDDMVAQYSQDEGSKPNKGIMNWISSGSRFPEEFKEVAFNLEKGDVSAVFSTSYGYHIIKLVDKKPIPALKEIEESIKTKISRDSRAESTKSAVAQRIKKENNFTENTANFKAFASSCDSSMFMDGFELDESKYGKKELFKLGNKSFNDLDFAKYLVNSHDYFQPGQSVYMMVSNIYKRYVEEKALGFEETQLEEKYEDFRNLMQEYHDGILLFDLTDKMVWGKAGIDTIGLEKFHEANKNKYMWKDRVRVLTYSCLDEKTKKAAMKMAAAGKTADEIKAKLAKKITGAVVVVEQKAEKGENVNLDKLYNAKGVVDIPNENGQFKFYYVVGIVGPEPKTLKEAKGLVTSDYQSYLEKEWIKSLRAKYPVTVNEEVIKTLFKK